jgi:hypothetical protein
MAALGAVRRQAGEVPLTITLAPSAAHFASGSRAAATRRGRVIDSCVEQDARDDAAGEPTRWYNGDRQAFWSPSTRAGRRRTAW